MEQMEFDFSQRGGQLRLLKDAPLADVIVLDGKRSVKVSAHVLRSILKEIDGFGRGQDGGAFPSAKTLGAATNLSERTVRRAIRGLQELSLLCVERKYSAMAHKTLNHYTVVWSELAARKTADQTDTVSGTKRTQCLVPNGHSVRYQTDMAADQTDTVSGTKRTQCPVPNGHSVRQSAHGSANGNDHYYKKVVAAVADYGSGANRVRYPRRAVDRSLEMGLTCEDILEIVAMASENRVSAADLARHLIEGAALPAVSEPGMPGAGQSGADRLFSAMKAKWREAGRPCSYDRLIEVFEAECLDRGLNPEGVEV